MLRVYMEEKGVHNYAGNQNEIINMKLISF